MLDQIQKKLQSTESFVSLILGIAVVAVIGTVVFNAVKTKSIQSEVGSGETKTNEEKASPVANLPASYTVSFGDTLWGISIKFYKTGYNWVDLAKANSVANADHIEVGQQLVIPNVTPIILPGDVGTGIMDKKPEQKSYTVVINDTLWGIAKSQYGNGFRWTDIARANALANPNLIHAGNVLTLP